MQLSHLPKVIVQQAVKQIAGQEENLNTFVHIFDSRKEDVIYGTDSEIFKFLVMQDIIISTYCAIRIIMKNLLKTFWLILPFFYVCAHASNTKKANTDQVNIIAVVKKAENYIRKYGKEKEIIDFKKNHADIFMGDYNGNFYLSPLHPELIGTNRFNYKDASGALVVQEEIEKAKAGGGWLKPPWRKNPQPGKYQYRKIYILPMPGNYFIGSWYNYYPDKSGNCSI
jgi:Cache domain